MTAPVLYARLNQYLRELPSGLASHPTAEMKASLYRGALDDRPLDDALPHLPPPVADLVTSPRLVSTWVPTTHVQCIYLAIADRYRMTDATFKEWSYQRQKRLYAGALYRALLAFASPGLLLQGAKLRWRAIHRGTDIELEPHGDREVSLSMAFPEALYSKTNLIGFEGAFRATAEATNGRTVISELESATRTTARYIVRWR